MNKVLLIILATLPLAARAERPKLIVNVVVSGIGSDLLNRYSEGLSEDGFRRFTNGGTRYQSASYGYMQTLSPVGIATLQTGADPSMHGVTGEAWVEPISGARVTLTGDLSVQGLGADPGSNQYSAAEILIPNLGDELMTQSPDSKVVSVAANPVSAVVAAGQKGRAFWLDAQRATWVSSTGYMASLPGWVVAYNTEHAANRHLAGGWSLARPKRQYVSAGEWRNKSFDRGGVNDYNALIHSALGNALVAEFAVKTLAEEGLGKDDATDILTVVFDPARWVGQRYGTRAMETEDMIYRLDMELAGMVDAMVREVGKLTDILFVITSDGGLSDATEKFNADQFKTILNSFLVSQFGAGEWVADYVDRQVYLNRNLVYKSTLSLTEVQRRAAIFALQFRGVSHVLTSTALMNGTFSDGYGAMMQRSFYPRRGGDLMLDFLPAYIEERADTQALGGSMYRSDRCVPLIFYGWEIAPAEVVEPVDMTSVAARLSSILGVELLYL